MIDLGPYSLDTIVVGDCLDVMRQMPDGCVGAVITDPPYGIGESGRKNKTRKQLAKPTDYGDYQWDAKLGREYIDAILGIAEDIVIFGGNYYADWLPASSSWIVWDKLNTGDFADCELAWTSHKKAVRKFSWRWNGFIKQQPEQRLHPTQKPLALMEWVVSNYTHEHAVIFDPFMGSGTTAVAAKKLGRHYFGCDISEEYVKMARERVAKIDGVQMPLSYTEMED